MTTVFHIAEPADWPPSGDEYTAPSLATEGFIHCSTAEQLDGVAEAFYAGRTDVTVLTIDERAVADTLVYEDLYDHGDEFPHVYGPIPVSAVLESRPLR